MQIARAEGVTFSMASAPFISDLCNAVEAGELWPKAFSKFNCAGAPIPPAVVERAYRMLGLLVCSAWGMTECGAVTVTPPAQALEKSGVSDGCPLPGIEVKVVDVDGAALPVGQSGELLIRGASLFGGYLKRTQAIAISDTRKEARKSSERVWRLSAAGALPASPRHPELRRARGTRRQGARMVLGGGDGFPRAPLLQAGTSVCSISRRGRNGPSGASAGPRTLRITASTARSRTVTRKTQPFSGKARTAAGAR